MTTNAGVLEHSRNSIGFGYKNFYISDSEKVMEQVFSPEFCNRLDCGYFFF